MSSFRPRSQPHRAYVRSALLILGLLLAFGGFQALFSGTPDRSTAATTATGEAGAPRLILVAQTTGGETKSTETTETTAETTTETKTETGETTDTSKTAETGASTQVVVKTLDGIPTYSLPNGAKLNLRISAEDTGSGVDTLYIKINDGDFHPIQGDSVTLTRDGDYNVSYYAVDRVGNKGETRRLRVRIDSRSPNVNITVANSPITSRREVKDTAVLLLRGSDEGVGLEKLQWRAGKDQEWRDYSDGVKLAEFKEGVIEYRATDRMGNVSPSGHFIFKVDMTAPAVPVLFPTSGAEDPNKVHRVPADGLRAPKPAEEDAKVFYKLNDSEYRPIEPGQKLEFPGDGEYTVTMRVVDELGNASERTFKVKVDTQPPASKLEVITNQ